MEDVAAQFVSSNQTIINLAVALLLGAIVGLERGWGARDQKSGERIAGIRTFALIGLLGAYPLCCRRPLRPGPFQFCC